MKQPISISAVLLVGGQGTRLRPVLSSTPKPLAPVGEQSFLEILVNYLGGQGISRLVMCTGYMSEQIQDGFGDGSKWGVRVEYSQEEQPLGTAGAVRHARKLLAKDREFLVLNGDSFLEADLGQLIRFRRERNGIAALALVRVPNASRYGTVSTEERGRIIAFKEKTGIETPGMINGGVYVFDQAIFEYLPDGPASLERDVFPQILQRGVYGLEQNGLFIDIGTPEDYALAQVLSDRLRDAAFGTKQG